MLHIQDPNFSNSYTLHEALIQSCSTSVQGRGAYAFVTKDGVEILLKDNEFSSFLDRGVYSLIVGIDEITNVASLDSLDLIRRVKPNLSVRAYYHSDKGSLFHPKLSFFRNQDETGTLIVGSGNLTLKGLRKNREAFTLSQLSIEEITRIEQYWDSWITQSERYLKEIDDPDVLMKVRENQLIRRRGIYRPEEEIDEIPLVPENLENDLVGIQHDGWQFSSDSEVLIAEIPRSGNRWKQANFDIDTFRTFFGATPGDNNQRILLRSINDDLTLSNIEIRQSVSVVSQNYRFELDAASGLTYPDQGKPIGVFVKITTRMFLYYIYMPDHPLYQSISDWLFANWTGRSDRMKRLTRRINQVDNIILQSVFGSFLVHE